MDMIERVGEAIAEAFTTRLTNNYSAFQTVLSKEAAEALARVAIEAMRNSTSEMERALARSAWQSGSGRNPADVIADVINAALVTTTSKL